MLTPLFEVSQCEEAISVKVHVPNTNLSQTEVTVTENIFLFNGAPYFLRLTFPHKLEDSELEGAIKVEYESDSCDFIFTCKKEVKGQFFPGLDMLTKLQADNKKKNTKPNIETISSSPNPDLTSEELAEDSLVNPSYVEKSVVDGYKYGFANARANIPGIHDLLYGFLDIKDPYNTSLKERKEQRVSKETQDFCPYHYIGDFKEKVASEDFLNFSPKLMTKNANGANESSMQYTNEEKIALNNLRRKEVLVSEDEKNQVLSGLLSILLSWCYTQRASEGEEWSESAWTLIKLTPMLSWFDTPDSLRESVHTFFRRCMTYPITRNFVCSQRVLEDVVAILKIGKPQILKCLLGVRSVFEESELFILNDLYISDYCVWIQSLEEEEVMRLCEETEKITIDKSELNLDLPLYERLSQEDSDEEEEALESQMDSLCLGNPMIGADQTAKKAANNNKYVIEHGASACSQPPISCELNAPKAEAEELSCDSSSDSDDSDDSSSDDSDDSSSDDSDDSSSDDSDDSSSEESDCSDSNLKDHHEDLDSDDSLDEHGTN